MPLKLHHPLKIFLSIIALCLSFTTSFAANNNAELNAELIAAMEAYHVPVVGYAIIKNNKIVAVKTISIDPKIKVSNESLFQAASISKSVSAYGALKLVQQGQLNLDTSVNNQLRTWQIPTNEYNKNDPVTLTQLLDMTSGLAVSGFPGHSQGTPLPTLNQILDGKSPANTAPIRVFYKPGTRYFYSGGSYEVLEKLIEDTLHKPFQTWMNDEILKSLNMMQSIFQYPLEAPQRFKAVPGFLMQGTMIQGGWNNYDAPAASGLWSTPTDVAKFMINISQSYQGDKEGLISKPMAAQMLTRQPHTDFGLGVVVNGEGSNLNFRKTGHNLGYYSQLLMFPNQGDGVIVMANSENGIWIINYIIPVITQMYHFPCYFPNFDEMFVIPRTAC